MEIFLDPSLSRTNLLQPDSLVTLSILRINSNRLSTSPLIHQSSFVMLSILTILVKIQSPSKLLPFPIETFSRWKTSKELPLNSHIWERLSTIVLPMSTCTETNGRLKEVLTLLTLSMFIEKLVKVLEVQLAKSVKSMVISRDPNLLAFPLKSKTPRDI